MPTSINRRTVLDRWLDLIIIIVVVVCFCEDNGLYGFVICDKTRTTIGTE